MLVCRLTLLALLIGLCGCATSASVERYKGKGMVQTFDAPYDKVWQELRKSVLSFGLGIDKDDPASGTMVAYRHVKWDTWGERVAIFVRKTSETSTSVEVVSHKVIRASITGEAWENSLFSALRRGLAT